MIFTVTLNPAIDRTIVLDYLKRGDVNRSQYSRIDVGGKGINVSKALKALDVKNTATGFLGNLNAGVFLDYLNEIGILTDFYMLKGEIRTNTKIVETIENIYTDINQRGLDVSDGDIDGFMEKLFSIVKIGDIVVLSGSLPPNADESLYANIISKLNEKGVVTVLDAEGEVLRRGVDAAPYAVKPNLSELKNLVSVDDNDIKSIVRGGQLLLDKGVKRVLISLGSKGAIYMTGTECLYSYSVPVDAKSAVGAGDAMVAGLVHSMQNELSSYDTLKIATACAGASVLRSGTQPPSHDVIMELLSDVVIEEV